MDTRIKVGLDASTLILPPSGTRTYISSLQEAFERSCPSLDTKLLIPDWQNYDEAPTTNYTLYWKMGRMSQVWRSMLRLKWDVHDVEKAAVRSKVEVLHVPLFSSPLVTRVTTVVTVFDLIPMVLPAYASSRIQRLRTALAKHSVPKASLIVTCSESSKSDIERLLGIASDRIRVIPLAAPHGYKPSKDSARIEAVKHRFGIGGRYIFNIGGFDVRKNLSTLVEAFSRSIVRLDESTCLVIAGATPLGNPAIVPPLEPLVKKFGLEGRVKLIGRVSEEEKEALYQGASLYVTPSLYEGFGLTALEAMACGVPTIASNRSSLPEVIGDAGILVEPEPDAISAAIVSVLSDDRKWIKLQELAIARAASYTWDRTARLTELAYREALARSR